MNKQAPIGIFDSGMGGLTVANAVGKLLPDEQLIYFGDSAHLPYGDKSAPTIQAYSVKICDLLLQKGCKVILIACNSASAAAYELLQAYVGSRALVINVIDPVVEYVTDHHSGNKVGLIGTKQTVGSGVYDHQIKIRDHTVELVALATPMLVPMIEAGFHKDEISGAIIEKYLGDEKLSDIKALILGCTHYPIIKKEITKFYTNKVEIIDSSEIVAKALKDLLDKHDLLSTKRAGENEFLVSDITPSFESATTLFFHKKVPLTLHVLWE